MWGREWVLLTYKHPQLPCWLLEISHLLTGSFRWPQYMLSQLLVSTTFVLVYLLARDIMGSTRAVAAVLLLPSVYFFGWPTPQFNHDYAQMPFWAGICWLLWRSARDGKPVWWLALGLVSGAGLYAKFSTGLLLLFGAIWLLFDARGRSLLDCRPERRSLRLAGETLSWKTTAGAGGVRRWRLGKPASAQSFAPPAACAS